MAHAYHLEALRKQRAIDRAYQARLRLEQATLQAETQQATSPVVSPQRPSAPEPPIATPAAETSRPVSQHGSRPTSQHGSRPTSQQGSRPASQQGSRPVSRQDDSEGKPPGSCQSSRASSRPSSQSGSRPASQQADSRPSSRQQGSTGRTSSSDSPVGTERQLAAVTKDLHKKELVLRDSNLVMGHISPREVLETMAE